MSGARNRAEIRRLLHVHTNQLLLQTHEEAQLKVNLEAEKVGAAADHPLLYVYNIAITPYPHAPRRCFVIWSCTSNTLTV